MAYTKDQILGLVAGSPAGQAAQLVDNYVTVKLYSDTVCVFDSAGGTFKGVGTPIGIRNYVNKVTMKMRASTATNITSIQWWLRIASTTGTILDTGTIAVNIDNTSTGQDVVFPMNSVIVNATNDQLYFMFKCDQTVNTQKNSTAILVYQNPPYNWASYSTGGGYLYSANINYNATIESYKKIPSPSTDFLSEITRLYVSPIKYAVPTAQIILPSKIYAEVGIEMNLYWENFIFTNMSIDKYDMVVLCTKGNSLQRCWRYTPVAGNVGSTTFLIQVFFDNVLINSATATLYTAATAAGSGITRRIINVGDSTTDAGVDTSTVVANNSGDVMTIIPQGIRGTNATSRHEGRTGWTSSDYVQQASRGSYYSFFVTVTTLSAGATYTNNGVTFTVVDVYNPGGSGRINCTASGVPATSGTLTKVSGIGDATITFSAWKMVAANPFWNLITSQIDFANYLTEYGFTMGSGDWVRINLGINDVYNIKSAGPGLIETAVANVIANLNNLIAAIQVVSGIRIAICLIHAPANSLDAFGAAQLQTMLRYVYNYRALLVALQTQFDTPAMNTNGIYVLGYNLCNDRVLNYPTSAGNANARNTTQVNYAGGGVHPATAGYQQMGDCLYSFLKYMA